jgi:hypothetical protein
MDRNKETNTCGLDTNSKEQIADSHPDLCEKNIETHEK